MFWNGRFLWNVMFSGRNNTTGTQWTTATHAWPFDCYCIILLYPDWRIQHSINWYINFQAVNLTGSMKLTRPPVHWTLWSPVRIRPRESTHVCVTFSSMRFVLRVYTIIQFVRFVMDDTSVQLTAWVFWRTIPRADWMENLGRNILWIGPEVPFLSRSNSVIHHLL